MKANLGRTAFLSFITLLCISAAPPSRAESLCAEVKLSLSQEVTLERQGFEAHMKITNGLQGIDIEDVAVSVTFKDADGNLTKASSDANDADPTVKFFITKDETQTDIVGDSVPGGTVANLYWTIIPVPDTTNTSPVGKLYYVGATLGYSVGGEIQQVEVSPDYIYVKPTPLLSLDYFLPDVGMGDDPSTCAIEAEQPFWLGVRVMNQGHGPANNFAVESAQPKIVDNALGLLIGFQIIGSEVNGGAADNSLKVNFGDIAASGVGTARWKMLTSLSGKFKDFKAEYSHADYLGGKLTSLIDAVRPHVLTRDVLVDAPGRDNIRDFLAHESGVYRLYESEIADSAAVRDVSTFAILGASTFAGNDESKPVSFGETAGFVFAKISFPGGKTRNLKSVVRSDGKKLLAENAWLSVVPNGGGDDDLCYLNVFDYNTPGAYTALFTSEDGTPHAPGLQFVSDKTVAPGSQVSFIVEASDQDKDEVTIAASPLPAGAVFRFDEFYDNQLYTYVFDWTPTAAQVGSYPITFTASDGALRTSRTMTITVGAGGKTLTVVNGSGSGSYAPDELVDISANPPASGMVFDQWTGDAVAAGLAAKGSLAMPNKDLVLTATYKAADFANDLIGHWPFEADSRGVAYDLAGFNFNGSVAGDAAWSDTGMLEGALSFDGQDDKVSTELSRDLPRWTLACWVDADTQPSADVNTCVVSKGGNFQLTWDNADPAQRLVARFKQQGQWVCANFGSVPSGAWAHLAATYDGETLKTFVNGVLASENQTPSGSPDSDSAPLSFAHGSDSDRYWAGALDDARLYQVALADTQVQELVVAATGIAATPDSYATAEDTPLSGDVLANDRSVYNKTLSSTVADSPRHGDLALNANGAFTYTPAANFSGADSFSYQVSDGSFLSFAVPVTITVNPVNDAPSAAADSFAVDENSTLSGNVLANDTDIDGDTLAAVLVANVAHGALTLNSDGSFSYAPAQDFSGADSFTYKANDGAADSATVAVALTVNPVSHGPVARADHYYTVTNVPLYSASVLRNDSGATQATLFDGVSHGALTFNPDGTFEYTPNSNFTGSDTFTYKAVNGALESELATVTVTTLDKSADSDSDGLTDYQELAILGSNPNVPDGDADADGDGLSNKVELAAGMNPTLAASTDPTYGYKFDTVTLEDAEDLDTDRWYRYGYQPEDAVISNAVDPDSPGNHAIRFSGYYGEYSPFCVKFPTCDISRFNYSWRQRFDSAFGLEFLCQTTRGAYSLNYSNSPPPSLQGCDNWNNHGLGFRSFNGEWFEVHRNLQRDFKDWFPNESVLYVYELRVRGDGYIDDLKTVAYLDADNDSLPDTVETAMGLDSANPADALLDADGDGLTNAEEVLVYKTALNTADSDGDGMSDGAEVMLSGTSPNLADSDGDGVPDGSEDLDSDGLTNSQEIAAAMDPRVAADTDPALGCLVERTVIEDAEDGDTDRWYGYGYQPSTSIISNDIDPDSPTNHAIHFSGFYGEYSPFCLAIKPERNQFKLSWRQRFSSSYKIEVYCETTRGGYTMSYNNSTSPGIYGNQNFVNHGLGPMSASGEWFQVNCDLELDLHAWYPNDRIIAVHGISVYGNGWIDDIVSSSYPDADRDLIPDNVETAAGLNPNDPADAKLDADNDGLINSDEALRGTGVNTPDSDGDGLTDGFEAHFTKTNPLVVDGSGDPDGDGLTNAAEMAAAMDPLVAADTDQTYGYRVERTALEDAENGDTVGWYIADNTPSAPFGNIVDPDDPNNRVINVAGQGYDNCFGLTLRPTDNQFKVSWRQRFVADADYEVEFLCETTTGPVAMSYDYSPTTYVEGDQRWVYHGLGDESCDGEWFAVRRDLQKDLWDCFPGRDILCVYEMRVWGNGQLDDIVSSAYPDADRDLIPDAVETAAGLNPNTPADAAGDLDDDGVSNLDEFLAGTL